MPSLPVFRQALVTMALVLALCPSSAAAQSTTGSISGVINDESGAVLPGVTIVVTQGGTGAARQQVSDSSGYYRLLNLSPGEYALRAELQGFNSDTRDRVTVAVSRDMRVDLLLRVSGLIDFVPVTAETSRIDLGSTTMGGVCLWQEA